MINFDYFNSTEIFWTALIVFVLAMLFHLWTSAQTHIQRKHEYPHPDRIDRGLAHFRKHKTKKITNDLWQEITGVSDATATRDLQELVELGILKKIGRGRGVHYLFRKHKNAS